MSAQVTIQLSQTKLVTSGRFGVTEAVGSATPALMGPVFVVEKLLAPVLDLERLVRIASLADLNNVLLIQNELQFFRDAGVDFDTGTTPSLDDVLRVFLAPEEWQYPQPAYIDFTVASYSAQTLRMQSLFPTMASGLTWELRRGGAMYRSGTTGFASREQDIDGPYKATAFTSFYDLSVEAMNHIASVQNQVRTLVDEASTSGAEYLAYAPGNPITTTFTE